MRTIEIEPATTALVLIDLQKGIVNTRREPYSSEEIIKQCAHLANRFRQVQAAVIYVHVDLANMVKLHVDSPMQDPQAPPPPPEAIEFVPEAGKQPSDIVILKHHWSAFLGTHLEETLRKRGIKTLVIGGIATNLGVESTARDAAGLEFNVIFVENAMTTFSSQAQQFAISTIFPKLGRVVKADELSFI